MKLQSIIFLWCTIALLGAVGEAGAIFLLIAPGAGPAGTGEAQVAKADDVYASYYNPAGLGFLKGKEAAGMHVQWLPNLATDLYYEFLGYRHYVDGLGSVGGHVIFLNLGEQIGMDETGKPTTNWSSFMAAASGSFGTQLSETSSIGFNFKIFRQKLADFTTGSEGGSGSSTDFGFDIGYLKKFRQSKSSIIFKKKKKMDGFFDLISNIRDRQNIINEDFIKILSVDSDIYKVIEDQQYLLEDLGDIRSRVVIYDNLESFNQLDDHLGVIISEMEDMVFVFDKLQKEELIPSEVEKFEDSTYVILDRILFNLLELDSNRELFISEIEKQEVGKINDKFNFGFSISNIGPKIDFVDVDQADPSPMNMRLGIFTQLYNDGFNKVNFLFDANKLLVTRYQMMDWDGDGLVGGYDESGYPISNQGEEIRGDYNKNGKMEYNSLKYIDDPWYLAIATAWLDDWLLGGDIDYDDDRKIGGWEWSESLDSNGDGIPSIDELVPNVYGKYNNGVGSDGENIQIERGSSDDRSIVKEFQEMIYNIGLEYWYTDAFALRAGYIHDAEGKIYNPTFGAGIRLLQYGFDFGYTAGEQGHPRANTMFFSVNIEL